MHILLLPSWYPEDAADFNGSFFPEQARALIKAGHQVGVLAVRGYPVYDASGYRTHRKAIRESVEDGIEVLRTDRILPIPKAHRLNYGILTRAWESLYERYVAVHGAPDVLHVHTVFPAGLAAAKISERTGVPYVITEHRISSRGRLATRTRRRLAEQAVRGASELVAVAPRFDEMLNEAYGLSEDPQWRYVPGLLSPQFEHIEPRAVPDGPFVVGHVSHLTDHKRIPLLIEGFADAFRGDDSVRLRIAGSSPDMPQLRALAAEEGITDQVDFVGSVPREGIVEEFASYHVFAMTSITEAFGTVLWEAMACGLPIVSTDSWAGLNAVREGNGILVPREDRGALADGLRRIRETFDDYDPAAVRRIAVDHSGQDAFTEQYGQIYRAAAGDRPDSAA